MPEHCAPKYFDKEREELWNGPPILTESDKPISFVFRVPLPRRASPADDSRDASAEAAVVPRGLPERKYHEQPARTYRARRKHNPEHSCVDPADIITYQDKPWYNQHGQWFPLDDGQPEDTLRDTSTHRKQLAEAVPGLTKRTRGRFVPKAGATDDPRRKHICPVETCRKAFTKRDHVNRHIMTIHGNGPYDAPSPCDKPGCTYTGVRHDNLSTHTRKHTHYHEIFMCTPEDGFKGIHLQNPRTLDPLFIDVKPFKKLPFPVPSLSLWQAQEMRRREEGADGPLSEHDCIGRYFAAHPEEVESYLAEDPQDLEAQWQMPPAGKGFTPLNDSCLIGRFKLDIKREQDTNDAEGSGSNSGGDGGDP
ncbi:hypothetical protein TRAPUB_4832 [Trametes pubescens]|uniref:C2H2-type domain-containing protein n=1 Tax=Trametes pubescens TaxID=154538 RepID=A0A1M2VAG0_TRAPU|nr:hypothetical protein TRAPUB_4832 [Trametes pubescens]